MRTLTTNPHHEQRGQALVEFAVLLLVLAPLVLLVARMGKLMDLYQTTELASRYAAFEATVANTRNAWKSDADLAKELQQRFFSAGTTTLLSRPGGGVRRPPNPLWTDAAGRSLLDPAKAVQVESATVRRNALTAPLLYARQFRLPNDNRYRASVTVVPSKLPGLRPFDRMNLDTTRKTIVLVDTWTAASARELEQRVMSAPLAFPLVAIEPVFDLLGHIPRLLFEPTLQVGHFDWDVVSCDRLSGACP